MRRAASRFAFYPRRDVALVCTWLSRGSTHVAESSARSTPPPKLRVSIQLEPARERLAVLLSQVPPGSAVCSAATHQRKSSALL